MTYREQLQPWVVYRLLPDLQRLLVARFRRRGDAEAYLKTIRRVMPRSQAVGGMGLVGGFGGVAIGAAPVAVAGAVVGSAVYGAKTAIEEGDTTALGALAGGAAVGAGVSTVVGGMGLAVGGTAIAIGMAPVVAVGAVAGLASYGLKKLLEAPKKDDSQ